MEPLFHKILNMLVTPPGNMIYHLILAYSVISSLQAALITRRAGAGKRPHRLIFGLGMLLLGQVILFFSSGLSWQGIINEHIFLPPLDRAVMVFSLIWIAWLWNFPVPAKLGDLVTGFLNLGVLLLLLFTFSSWSAQNQGVSFNGTLPDRTWELAALFIVITGMAILIFSRPNGWGFGVGMLSVSMAGIVAHLLLPLEGDFSGVMRLGQLAAFPLLPTLLHHLSTPEHAPEAGVLSLPAGAPAGAFPRKQERRRYSTDPRTVHAWLEIKTADTPEKVMTGMAKALSHTMLADLCFIVTGPNYGHVVLQSGYDLIREEEMHGTMLDQSQLPQLTNALSRGKLLRVTANDTQPPDLRAISAAFGLNESGSLLFIPLVLDEQPQGGILFLSPYSNRQWTTDDQNYLASETEVIARILRDVQDEGNRQQNAGSLGENLQAELEKLREENRSLLIELGNFRNVSFAAGQPVPTTDITALVALQEEAQNQINHLQIENERLQSLLQQQDDSVFSPEEFTRLEFELRVTLQEIAQLQNQLAEANARILILERDLQEARPAAQEERALVVNLVQELRQPMSSILGYTDLLLSETVGILGAMQQKFLERIKSSIARMESLLDDLGQVSAAEEGPVEILPQPVELGAIIDSSVAESSAQLREKDIALLVDLPDEMPQISTDRDAIQLIIVHLLQNAGAATPNEGSITLRARPQEESGETYLLLQVSDNGKGIHTDDLPRIFAQRHRAEMPLIEGIGDKGVSLSIAKALVDAHQGRIWVDSAAGQGTTFSVLLPIRSHLSNVKQE